MNEPARSSPEPSRLELLAAAAGVDYWDAYEWLEAEVDRRRRERHGMHLSAYLALDKRLERLPGDGADET